MVQFTRDSIPEADCFGSYEKTTETLAVRVEGSFTVVTPSGELYCEDGYLAVDTDGNPYPIPGEVFEDNYKLILEAPTALDPVDTEPEGPFVGEESETAAPEVEPGRGLSRKGPFQDSGKGGNRVTPRSGRADNPSGNPFQS